MSLDYTTGTWFHLKADWEILLIGLITNFLDVKKAFISVNERFSLKS